MIAQGHVVSSSKHGRLESSPSASSPLYTSSVHVEFFLCKWYYIDTLRNEKKMLQNTVQTSLRQDEFSETRFTLLSETTRKQNV